MAATAPGTHLSHWAATRVFDRLEGFGKVRELSVHASAIRASQAPTWRGVPALSEFKAMVLKAVAYFQSITRSELSKISGKEVSRDTIASLTSGPRSPTPGAPCKRAGHSGAPLIGVCAGTFVLAEAGLMTQHYTCVSWLHFRVFRALFPDHRVRVDRIYNLDKQRGSCAGGSSAADMAATIVRRFISREAECNALEVLQLDKARTLADIQPRRPLALDCEDNRLRVVLILMESHLDETLSVQKLAATSACRAANWNGSLQRN